MAAWPTEYAEAGMVKRDALVLLTWLHQPAPASQALLSSPSQLPGKQNTAKMRAFPEAVEVACIRDCRARAGHLQRPAQ